MGGNLNGKIIDMEMLKIREKLSQKFSSTETLKAFLIEKLYE